MNVPANMARTGRGDRTSPRPPRPRRPYWPCSRPQRPARAAFVSHRHPREPHRTHVDVRLLWPHGDGFEPFTLGVESDVERLQLALELGIQRLQLGLHRVDARIGALDVRRFLATALEPPRRGRRAPDRASPAAQERAEHGGADRDRALHLLLLELLGLARLCRLHALELGAQPLEPRLVLRLQRRGAGIALLTPEIAQADPEVALALAGTRGRPEPRRALQLERQLAHQPVGQLALPA